MSPRALKSASKVRAPILRRWALSLENAISIGFRSGEYGGKKRDRRPLSFNACAARGFWWVDRYCPVHYRSQLQGRGKLGLYIGLKCEAIYYRQVNAAFTERHRSVITQGAISASYCQLGDEGLRAPNFQTAQCRKASHP